MTRDLTPPSPPLPQGQRELERQAHEGVSFPAGLLRALGGVALVGCSLVGAATLWSACTSPLPGGPLANLGPESRERRTIEGRPVEQLRAGSYTYVRIEDERGQRRWVVTMGRIPEGAARVEARTLARTTDFRSQRLQRRFDELFFGTIRAVVP